MTQASDAIDTFDVAIIGYGPTGLALAQLLGSAGHRTVVIEKWPELYKLPRAAHIDGEVMRLFQRMGVAEEIAGDSSITRHTRILDCDGIEIATVPAEDCDQGWCSHYSLFQPNLERTLDAKVRASGHVTVLQGWQAEAVERRADGTVAIQIASGEGDDGIWRPTGSHREVAAKWLVGADGANSLVQQVLGQAVDDLGYKSRALVIFAERLDPAVGATMPDALVGMVLPRPYVAMRESGKRFARWEFHISDEESSSEMGHAAKAWELIAPWGFTPANARLVRHSVFEFRTLVVENWRDGNIMLAGDAAHRMPPFQGQGMCGGLRDAAALAWRLDLVLRGVCGDKLLDTYTAERRPHVLELTKNAAERGKVFWSTDPEAARARDARMKEGLVSENLSKSYGSVPSLADGLLMRSAGGLVEPAGQLSAQFLVDHRGSRMRLDDHIGFNWHLLTIDPSLLNALRAEDRELLKRLNAHTIVIDDGASPQNFADVEGGYAEWLGRLDRRLVLVRPDSYIFGAAADGEGVRSLFAALRDQLCLATEPA